MGARSTNYAVFKFVQEFQGAIRDKELIMTVKTEIVARMKMVLMNII